MKAIQSDMNHIADIIADLNRQILLTIFNVVYEMRLNCISMICKTYFDDQSVGCFYLCRVEDTRRNFVDSLI